MLSAMTTAQSRPMRTPLPLRPTRLAPVGRSSRLATTSVNALTSSMIIAVAMAVSVLPVEMLR